MTFKSQVTFSAIALKTLSKGDCTNDPKKAQFYIATPTNEWKFIGGITFKEEYKRNVSILTYTGMYRTHALMILLENDFEKAGT